MTPPGDDIDRIMAIMDIAFPPEFGEAWTRRQVEDACMMGSCHYALIGADGAAPMPGQAAAGFFLARHLVDEDELLLLAVAPLARNRGLGQTLLDQFAADARSRGSRRLILEMREDNPAEHLYRRCGFIDVGRRTKYYRRPDGSLRDAITFSRYLDRP